MMNITCSNCSSNYTLPDSYADASYQCLRCGDFIDLPAQAKAPPKAPAKAPARGNKATIRQKPATTQETAQIKLAPDAPRKRRRISDEEPEERDRRPGIPRWIGKFALALVCLSMLGGLGWFLYFKYSTREDTNRKKVLPRGITPAMAELTEMSKTAPAPKKAPDRTPPVAPPKPPPEPARTGNADPPVEPTGTAIYQQILKSTVYIAVRGDNFVGAGSGVIIDRTNRLILTNVHVVEKSIENRVFFPAYDHGKLVTDAGYYEKLKPSDQIVARVIASDSHCDLALLQVPRLPDSARALPVAGPSAAPGTVVHSIGSPKTGLWIYTAGAVRQVSHMKIESKTHVGTMHIDAEVVQTTSPVNPGDSGGPLVNSRGELIGLAHGYSPDAQLTSYFIDVTEIHKFVNTGCKNNGVTWARAEPRKVATPGTMLDLIKNLDKADGSARAKAAQALGEAGPIARVAVPALLARLKDPDALVRKLAAEALEQIGAPDKSDIGLLRESLRDGDPTVRGYATNALGLIGPDARDAAADLVTLFKGETVPSIRQSAIRALGRLGHDVRDTTFRALQAALKDPESFIRLTAAEAIAMLGPFGEKDLAILLELTRHEDVEIRVAGIEALAQARGQAKTAVPALIALAKAGADVRQRRAALVALAAFGKESKPALPLLSAAVKDDDPEIRRAACPVLQMLGGDARPAVGAIAEALATADNPTRVMLLEVLEKLGSDARDALPALRKLLTEKERTVLVRTLAVLEKLGRDAKDAAPALIILLQEKDSAVFDGTIAALVKIGRVGVPLLIAAMRDENARVRLGAVRTCGKLGAEARAAIQPLAILARADPAADVRAEAMESWKAVVTGRPKK